ncbi:hypothetical protein FO519_003433 [Halicephalobus sp. NKZ332]|nr:hypothetical protein FO519_003433 [Halicephalobus sp. NKZ332]
MSESFTNMTVDPRKSKLEEIFPGYEIDIIFQSNPNSTVEEMAAWIVENQAKFRPKSNFNPRTKRIRTESVLSSCSTEVDPAEGKSGFAFLKTIWKKISGSNKKNSTLCCVCYEPQKKNRKFYTCSSSDSSDVHFFCRSCILGLAKAVAESAPLSSCGTGFPCMETDCKNKIDYDEIRRLIPRKIRKRIDERILEENVSKAGIKIEKCNFCNFPLELPPKEENKVFDCPECWIKTCRICQERWDEDHLGVPCQELLSASGSAKLQRFIEQKINETVVRRCHQCNLQFTKTEGCNHMKCRCGAVQCYVCKKPEVKFSHFCRCGPVCDCQKPCRLYEPARSIHKREINEIKKNITSIPNSSIKERL